MIDGEVAAGERIQRRKTQIGKGFPRIIVIKEYLILPHRIIYPEPGLVGPADRPAVPPHDSGGADPLDRSETWIVRCDVQIRHQIPAGGKDPLLHLSHRDFPETRLRPTCPPRGHRGGDAGGLADLHHDRLEPGRAIRDAGHGHRLLYHKNILGLLRNHDPERNREGRDRMELQLRKIPPIRIAIVMMVNRIVPHRDGRAVKGV